jgi:hypothetical protein
MDVIDPDGGTACVHQHQSHIRAGAKQEGPNIV